MLNKIVGRQIAIKQRKSLRPTAYTRKTKNHTLKRRGQTKTNKKKPRKSRQKAGGFKFSDEGRARNTNLLKKGLSFIKNNWRKGIHKLGSLHDDSLPVKGGGFARKY